MSIASTVSLPDSHTQKIPLSCAHSEDVHKKSEKTCVKNEENYACPENVSKKGQKSDILVNYLNLDDSLKHLSFQRLKLPRLIPIELIESVRGRSFTPEQFYKYQESQLGNDYNHLYAVIDKSNKIEGYLWAEVNFLDNSLFVNTFSISKKFWRNGKAIVLASLFLKDLKEKVQAPRLFWITSNEKFFLKNGFKRSRNCLMEYATLWDKEFFQCPDNCHS